MNNNYNNIPLELRLLPQWVVWDANKVPHDAKTNVYANVNDPNSWSDFDTAVSMANKYCGVGFVFTDTDSYSFIDLDDTKGDQIALNRQIEIYREFDSYSEISPSGKGLHIIVRGNIPAGRRRSFIEIYSSQRYATFTGNVYNDKPIVDRQQQLTQLWQQMGDGPVAMTMMENQPEIQNDQDVIRIAEAASNGDKFKQLYNGTWQDIYQSQSEADFALIDILAFYTQNRTQISRIFRSSGLGRRSKANRNDYLSWMINKSFDRMLPPIDFDGFRNQLELKLVEGRKQEIVIEPTLPGIVPSIVVPIAPSTIPVPPGLLGELAQFIYQAAPLPVIEIALAGAIGFMAGICGRSYNVNQEGLNQYILLIAQSGTGKEAMASGIDKIISTLKFQCPTSSRIVGPAEITSGEALVRYINKANNQCFVSILSEFGYRLQVLSDKRNFPQATLKRILLQLYHMGGKGRVYKPKIFSDKEKDISETLSPAFSILAETTPETFYECINAEIVADGFLPRFIMIEYKGERVPLNQNMITIPHSGLIIKIASFFAHCETLNQTNNPINVLEDAAVKKELAEFEEYVRNMINKNAREDIRQLWNRAHIKAWKLAALIAVGVHPYSPMIVIEHWRWAVNIVMNDIRLLSAKFDVGEIGNSSIEIKQMKDIRKTIRDYFKLSPEKMITYQVKQNLFNEKKIPWGYLSRRLHTMSAFNKREERIRGSDAIKHAIDIMIDRGELRECSNISMKSSFAGREVSFVVTDVKILDVEE